MSATSGFTAGDSNSGGESDGSQITHVLNRDKKSLCDHGQRLFNAINCLLNDDEQMELTQSLFKYQKDHNVFTLVRSCREIFETKRKKSLMLFMRPVIPIRDRFHYDEYHKLFFPEEFPPNTRSIFAELMPKELMQKTFDKVNKKLAETEAHIEAERKRTIEQLEKSNYDLNLDIEKILNTSKEIMTAAAELAQMNPNDGTMVMDASAMRIAGFRIIDLEPNENESLGFGICLGPTKTFIMILFVEPGSTVEKLGMKVGDELVSVNEISLKMTSVDEAIEILSSATSLRIVLQTSGFMPEPEDFEMAEIGNNNANDGNCDNEIDEWMDPFGLPIASPSESTVRSHLRYINVKVKDLRKRSIGITIRGGIEYGLGVFIVNIDHDSPGFNAGLRVGDHFLYINDCSFARVTHMDAIKLVKTCINKAIKQNQSIIRFTVRYLGKLPTIKCLDSTVNNNVDTRIDTVTFKTLNSIDETNRIRLAINSFSNKLSAANTSAECSFKLKYYLREYLNDNITFDHFLYVLKDELKLKSNDAELLREFINKCDRNKFEDYVIELSFSQLDLSSDKSKANSKKKTPIDNDLMIKLYKCTNVKSIEDLSSLNRQPPLHYKFERRKSSILIKHISKSLDNLNYFLSLDEDSTTDKDKSTKKKLDEATINNIMQNYGVPFLVSIKKTQPTLGLVFEGGINTKQLIPKVVQVQDDGCAASHLKPGQLLLNVDKVSFIGLTYRQTAKLLADAFKVKNADTLDLIVAEPNQPTTQ